MHQSSLSRSLAAQFLAALILLLLGALAPQPALAARATLTGIVTDNLGNRIQNATVRVTAGPTRASTTTGANGRYTFSSLLPGDYSITAHRSGFDDDVRTITLASAQNGQLDFTLLATVPEPSTLRGRVNDRNTGDLVTNAAVSISGPVGSFDTTTDAQGVYSFTDIPAGSYNMVVSRAGYTTLRRNGVRVRRGETTTVNVQLRPNRRDLARLQGKVTDTDGRVIPGARVVLVGGIADGRQDTTDSRGNYVINGITPDAYDVQFSAAGFATALHAGVVLDAGSTITLDQVLTPLGAQTASFEGFVLDDVAQPIAGARVEILTGPVTRRSGFTDATGFYRIQNLPAGQYSLRASSTGFDPEQQFAVATVDQATRVDFTLTANNADAGGVIAGRVTTVSGTGISGAAVSVTSGPVTGQSDTTDSSGNYSISGLPEGRYTLSFSATGFQDRSITNILVAAGRATIQDVQLQANSTGGGSATLKGIVRDQDDTTMAGVEVDLLESGGTVAGSTTTSLAGRYTFTNVTPGTYSVRFSKSGFETVTTTDVTLQADATTIVDARLTATGDEDNGATVSGRVQDTAGRRLQGIQVELIDASGGSISTNTDANGQFTFDGVDAGTYTLRASGTGIETKEITNIDVADGDSPSFTITVRLSTTTGAITGTVRANSGVALSGATITIVAGTNSSVIGASRTTTTDGRFTFVGLPAGTYRLEARAPGFLTQRLDVAVRNGLVSSITFTLRK